MIAISFLILSPEMDLWFYKTKMQATTCENHSISNTNEKTETKETKEIGATSKEGRATGKKKGRKGPYCCKNR